MKVISHNYQSGATQDLSDFVYGTGGIVRNAHKFKGEQVLFCGVLYMAEDLYVMADGELELFIPEIAVQNGEIVHPRCPMIRKQPGERMSKTDVVDIAMVEEARAMGVDSVLAYINTPISLKGESDGVYNGTEAIRMIESIADENGGRGSVALIGDENVNGWIADVASPKYPIFKIISIPARGVCCPSHLSIPTELFIETFNELEKEYGAGNVGLELHAEVNSELRRFGFEHDAYFGGTGGLVDNVKNSKLDVWLIGTVEGVIDRLKRDTTKKIYSLNAICPNMAFTSPPKVVRAKKILAEKGPAAEIIFAKRSQPYYEIEILDETEVRHSKRRSSGDIIPDGFSFVPAVRFKVAEEFIAPGKKALQMLM